MSPSETLEAWRLRAAAASGGASIDALYDRAVAWLRTVPAGGRVLDYGAGTGSLSRLLLETQRFDAITGADLMQRPSELPGAIEWLAQDLNQPLDLAPGGFDAILSVEVIEHLENPRAVARDWFRLLKPGGNALLTVPINPTRPTYENPSITTAPSSSSSRNSRSQIACASGCSPLSWSFLRRWRYSSMCRIALST